MCSVVVFKENSIFQKAGNLWYYVEADGDVAYEGDSLADAFDSPERQEAIAKGYADREKKCASSNLSSNKGSSKESNTEGSAKPSSPPALTAPVAKAAETEEAAPPPAPAAKKEAAPEPGSADEMDKLRSALMDM